MSVEDSVNDAHKRIDVVVTDVTKLTIDQALIKKDLIINELQTQLNKTEIFGDGNGKKGLKNSYEKISDWVDEQKSGRKKVEGWMNLIYKTAITATVAAVAAKVFGVIGL